jgi:hypothetical protein
MAESRFTWWLTANQLVRRVADAGFHAIARRRMRQLDAHNVAAVQERTLLDLVRRARRTQFGQAHDFGRIHCHADFQRLVPLRTYEDFWRDYWQPAFPRLAGVTWPSALPYYALSSGTTSGTTKYVPVSREMLRSNQKAGATVISAFLNSTPLARLLSGQMFFLGGSTDLVKQADGSLAGDLSGIATREVPRLLRPYSYPPLDLALINDWDVKVQRLAEDSAKRNITLIGGVPSWLLILFTKLRQLTGKDRLIDIWPNLRLLIHGGVKFDPYRESLRREIGSERVRFVETYPCSEGFISFEDPRFNLLRLIPDHGLFYEFVPVEELDEPNPTRHGAANVELSVQYAVVLTTCAGLWAYVVGDTVAFERRDPPLLRFTGRTRYFLSAFGEHLISEEIERAMAATATATGAAIRDFHVGPVFPEQPGELGRHQYLVEFDRAPLDLRGFGQQLDAELCRINDDYRAHRAGGVGMAAPQVVPLSPGAFASWMRAQGKLGGQHKVPRMDNTGGLTKQIGVWMTQNGHSQRLAASELASNGPGFAVRHAGATLE